ncbi:hypothetical protein ACEPPN_001466 [Leptodophora sp. 'Broadleaf-Isolate-01']
MKNITYGPRNDTVGTVVVQLVSHVQEETQDQDSKPEKERERRSERIEIKPPYTLTPHIVIVQRMVDRAAEAVRERGGEMGGDSGDGDAGLDSNLKSDSNSDDAKDNDESDFLDKEPHRGKNAGDGYVAATNDTQFVSMEWIPNVGGNERGDGTEDGMEDGKERDGKREQIEKAEEKMGEYVQTNGLNDEDGDGDGDGVAVLMGWTAQVGVVGILAIAPAG